MRIFWLVLFFGCTDSTDETGLNCVDNDLDGFTDCDDCDDTNPNSYPGAEEMCDGEDNNCDGEILYEGTDGAECQSCATHDLFYLTQIKTDLSTALNEATEEASCSYSNATRYMFTSLDKILGEVECVYTGRKVTVGSEKPDPNDMNTEHTWPQSQGAGSEPARCDLHHLFPTDSDANQVRADLLLDNVTSNNNWSEGGSKQGRNSEGQEVFEPRDAHKGNAARAIFYFSNRYVYPLSDAEITTYLAWHTLDPVDDAEMARAEEIQRRQGNPNPFVFCPMLVPKLADAAF